MGTEKKKFKEVSSDSSIKSLTANGKCIFYEFFCRGCLGMTLMLYLITYTAVNIDGSTSASTALHGNKLLVLPSDV